MEKLSPGDRLLSEFSSGINRINFWQQRPKNVLGRTFIYAVNKISPEMAKDVEYSRRFLRMLIAYETIMNVGVGFGSYGSEPLTLGKVFPGCGDQSLSEKMALMDELRGGDGDSPNWLGEARGGVKRVALSTPDLLRGSGRAMADDFVRNVRPGPDTGVARMEKVGRQSHLRVTRRSDQSRSLRFSLEDLPLEANRDFTIALDVRGDRRNENVEGRESCSTVPRTMSVKFRDSSVLSDHQHSDLSGLIGGSAEGAYRRLLFAFRTAKQFSASRASLDFVVEGGEAVDIRNVTVHAAPDAMGREFANGVVLANMSEHRVVEFDLGRLFGPGTFRRISASPCQADGFNTGAVVADGVVNLGPELGVFLVRE